MSKLTFIDQEFQTDRSDYLQAELNEEDLNPDPLAQLMDWLKEAYKMKCPEANAFCLSTTTAQQASQRILLLKAVTDSSLIFFTNYQSLKGREIEANPKVSALFFWPSLERQIRIIGEVFKTSKEVSDTYFQSRPKSAQVSATVSKQSSKVESRTYLEQLVSDFEESQSEDSLECPEYWGGYEIKPDYYEFWQGRRDRLHDRLTYEKQAGSWNIFRLSP